MKKAFFIFALGLSMVTHAQIVSDQEQALVYYMPQTEIVLTVKYEVETLQPGRLAEYAELLGINHAITEADTLYRLLDIETGTRTSADKSRICKVVAESGIDLQLLNINEKGLLVGYNLESKSKKQETRNKKQATEYKEQQAVEVKTLLEEALKAENDKELAQAVVEQILRLREARLYLLTGESENPPKDGKQFELTLQAIHEEEQQLVEMFTGKRETKIEEKCLYYKPEQSTEVIIARFDTHKGIVSEKEDGMPIRLTIYANKQRLMSQSADVKKDKKAPQPSPIYYNLPGDAHYILRTGEKEWVDRTIWVGQFGISVPLTRDLFMEKGTKIRFNEKTGNVESICK